MRSVLLSLMLITCLFSVSAAAQDAGSPRVVAVGLFLVDISALDERTETYTAEFDVITRWKDPMRAFEPQPGEEIPRLLIGSEAVAYLDSSWTAAIFAVNVVDKSDQGRPRLLLYPDGTITVRSHVRRTLRANLDFRKFPFDSQVLPVYIESLMHDSDELVLEAESEFTGFDEAFKMPEWTVTDLTTVNEIRERIQEKQDYDRLSFLVHIDRLSGYYVWKIMLPMVIIVMLSWIVFWMTEEMLGRRAGVSATCMLTVIAYQFVVSGALPRFPYLTVMDRFTLVSLLMIAATMLINLLGSRLEVPRRYTLDQFSRVVFPVAYVLAVAVVLAGGRGGS